MHMPTILHFLSIPIWVTPDETLSTYFLKTQKKFPNIKGGEIKHNIENDKIEVDKTLKILFYPFYKPFVVT